jgi:hypothetical protein
LSKKIIKGISVFVGFSHVLLLIFDGFPFFRTLFSITTLGWCSLMLSTFPVIQLSSPVFLISCVLVVSNHFSWFYYFSVHPYTFTQVCTLFGICVWGVPFIYILSLSANEYTLPAFDASISTNGHQQDPMMSPKKQGNLLKGFMKRVMEALDLTSIVSNPSKKKSTL